MRRCNHNKFRSSLPYLGDVMVWIGWFLHYPIYAAIVMGLARELLFI